VNTQFLQDKITALHHKYESANLKIQTFGDFKVWVNKQAIPAKQYGRDKTLQLFQYLIISRHRHAQHKEQIIDRLWEDAGQKDGDRDFKVALHGINKAIEPDRGSRSDTTFIIRNGLSYYLNLEECWIDADAIEAFISIGNEAINNNIEIAKTAYREALALHRGSFLPNRMFEDWTSEERERMQILILGAYINLAELCLTYSPMESIRLTQQALLLDATWEDAYRIQMQAYSLNGNRPAVIKTYQKCQDILDEEFGIDPLPITKKVYEDIMKN
jgi:DNA-binding SARP family transcriptional activator